MNTGSFSSYSANSLIASFIREEIGESLPAFATSAFLEAIAKYIRQLGKEYSQKEIISSFKNISPILRQSIFQLIARILPQNLRISDANSEKSPLSREEIESLISDQDSRSQNNINDIIYDYIIVCLAIVRGSVRCFYINNGNNTNNATEWEIDDRDLNEYRHDDKFNIVSSFKVSLQKISGISSNNLFAEIFVYSRMFEGIHTRGDAVARGGIRWSERYDDYRTEVGMLVEAQMLKNSIIVPSGSKGGFVANYSTFTELNLTKSGDSLSAGIVSYRMFIDSLLFLTDNIVDGEIQRNCIALDEDDPYLVVAADKGTANFSNIANKISSKYNFWLGDAFASGGTNGYSHKALGITARGGWESVREQFWRIGRDITNKDDIITTAGIGSMSGDVFGNGMLFLENIKLVAAFSDLLIFLDPNPDLKISYEERKRLFHSQSGSWDNYNAQYISKGGGVFSRKADKIPISKEVKEVLGIELDVAEMTPDELIRSILKSPVDLLWNGGIGTYIKSSDQNNADAKDKECDKVRINGNELRCKVVGEGGNLGFTMLGRIQYARNNGKVSGDFIDNSAGVDCSDHEVNFKIALSDFINANIIVSSGRDSLLKSVEQDAVNLCLQDNILQSEVLTFEEVMSDHDENALDRIKNYSTFLNIVDSRSKIKSSRDMLPTIAQINKDSGGESPAQRLSRPEFAIMLSYAKVCLKSMIDGDIKLSRLRDYCAHAIRQYFPDKFVSLGEHILYRHRLENSIVQNVFVNDIVNTCGIVFPVRAFIAIGGDLIHVFYIVKYLLRIETCLDILERIKSKCPVDEYLRISVFLRKLIVVMCVYISLHCEKSSIDSTADESRDEGDEKTQYSEILNKFLIDYDRSSTKREKNSSYEHEKNSSILNEISHIEDIALTALEKMLNTFAKIDFRTLHSNKEKIYKVICNVNIVEDYQTLQSEIGNIISEILGWRLSH